VGQDNWANKEKKEHNEVGYSCLPASAMARRNIARAINRNLGCSRATEPLLSCDGTAAKKPSQNCNEPVVRRSLWIVILQHRRSWSPHVDWMEIETSVLADIARRQVVLHP